MLKSSSNIYQGYLMWGAIMINMDRADKKNQGMRINMEMGSQLAVSLKG